MGENDLQIRRLHVRVAGRVQGVGFRAFVHHTAAQLGLKGWVRNRWDGSVEIVAEGEEPALKELLTELHTGPRGANVTAVHHDWELASGEFSHFFVRRTD